MTDVDRSTRIYVAKMLELAEERGLTLMELDTRVPGRVRFARKGGYLELGWDDTRGTPSEYLFSRITLEAGR